MGVGADEKTQLKVFVCLFVLPGILAYFLPTVGGQP
jgi:hypothetical protein